MPVCFCKAFFSVLSVEGVEGAVAAVGGKELGGSGASSFAKETCKGCWKSSKALDDDGRDDWPFEGVLRMAITTAISSRESSGWLMSSFEGVFESSIFTEEKGPKSICGIFWLALDAGGCVSASLAGLEDLVSIISE